MSNRCFHFFLNKNPDPERNPASTHDPGRLFLADTCPKPGSGAISSIFRRYSGILEDHVFFILAQMHEEIL
jgi:hypothetical protein